MKIELQNIEKKFKTGFELKIDKLKVADCEVVGIVGNNGAGKTTLLRLILDLIRPDNGKILFNGIDVSKAKTWKENTGAFICKDYLIPFLSPEEYFYFIGDLHNKSKSEIDSILTQYDRFFNNEILGKDGKLIRSFSSGNKMKIGIVSTMIFNPKVLILDEPYNSLDPTSQIILNKILMKMRLKHFTTIIISSHNLEHVAEICSRLLVVDSGKIIHDFEKSYETIEKVKHYFNAQLD